MLFLFYFLSVTQLQILFFLLLNFFSFIQFSILSFSVFPSLQLEELEELIQDVSPARVGHLQLDTIRITPHSQFFFPSTQCRRFCLPQLNKRRASIDQHASDSLLLHFHLAHHH